MVHTSVRHRERDVRPVPPLHSTARAPSPAAAATASSTVSYELQQSRGTLSKERGGGAVPSPPSPPPLPFRAAMMMRLSTLALSAHSLCRRGLRYPFGLNYSLPTCLALTMLPEFGRNFVMHAVCIDAHCFEDMLSNGEVSSGDCGMVTGTLCDSAALTES